jgi:hypothetical protein
LADRVGSCRTKPCPPFDFAQGRLLSPEEGEKDGAPGDANLYQVKFLENGLDTFFRKEGSVHRELRVKYADFVDFVAPR